MRKALPLWKGQSGATQETPPDLLTTLCQPAHESKAVQSPNPRGNERRAHAQVPDCLSTPTAHLAHTNGCRASAMSSRRMSRYKLSLGKSDNRRMKPSTMDHQLSSQGLPANSLKMTWRRISIHCADESTDLGAQVRCSQEDRAPSHRPHA